MPRTKAAKSFEENWRTVELISQFTEDRAGRSHEQTAALNQAALIFCITAWEGYVEDALKESATYLAEHCPSYDKLPQEVRRQLELAVTPGKGWGSKSPSGYYVGDLAGAGWRTLLRTLATQATEGSNFNTPKSKNVKGLFSSWCGIDVTSVWSWQNFASPNAAKRLDESITLRGQIVHTGSKPDGINKAWIDTYGRKNIFKLVEKTDMLLISHINSICSNEENPFGDA